MVLVFFLKKNVLVNEVEGFLYYVFDVENSDEMESVFFGNGVIEVVNIFYMIIVVFVV